MVWRRLSPLPLLRWLPSAGWGGAPGSGVPVSQRRRRWKDTGLVLVLTSTWGVGFVAGKVVVAHGPALTATGLRFLIAGAILRACGHAESRGRRPRPHEVILAGLASAGLYLFWNLGLRGTTAGGTALLVNTSPIFVSILARLVFGEPITVSKTLGLAVATVGVAVTVVKGSIGTWSGIALCLTAAIFWAIYTVVNKAAEASDPVALVAPALLSSGGALLVLGVIFEPHHVDFTLELVVACVILQGIVFNLLGWVSLLRRRPASQVAPWLFLVPMFGVLWSDVILGERVSWRLVLGTFLVAFGIVLCNLGRTRRAERSGWPAGSLGTDGRRRHRGAQGQRRPGGHGRR